MRDESLRGYCLKDKEGYQIANIHICGYEHDKILIQNGAGTKVRKLRIYENNKGDYFKFNNKKYSLPK